MGSHSNPDNYVTDVGFGVTNLPGLNDSQKAILVHEVYRIAGVATITAVTQESPRLPERIVLQLTTHRSYDAYVVQRNVSSKVNELLKDWGF